MTTVDNFMPYGEHHGISVDDFIKTFSVNESPARPTLAHMGAPYAPNSSPYRPGASNYNDANNAAAEPEWFGVDYHSMSLTESAPSSRGSSLETPNMQQSTFMPSIDPSRLNKEMNSYESNKSRQPSPAWSIPSRQMSQTPMSQQSSQQQQQQQPTLTLNTTNLQVPMSGPGSCTSTQAGSPLDLAPQSQVSTTPTSATTVTSSKRKRQGSLPEIYVPMSQQSLAPRTLQRSVSTGASMEPGDYMPPVETQTQSPYVSQASPITGPMSAPAISYHPHSFAPAMAQQQPQSQPQSQPQQLQPQTQPQPTGSHSAVNRFSSLATIPETPNSAPADATAQFVQQQQEQQQHHHEQQQHMHQQQQQHHLQQMDQHAHQQHQQQLQNYRYANSDIPNYHPATPTLPASTGHSPMLQQGAPLPMGRPMHLLHHRSASAGFPLPPSHHHMQQHQQQMQMGSYHPQHGQHVNAPTALGLNPAAGLGMGRPIHTPAHMRRSSDSELAFGVGPNVGAMARSTSVPQVPGQIIRPVHGMNVYGSAQGLPPPPPVTTYSAHNIAGPYAESFVNTTHNLYPEGPNLPSTSSRSPPRKRVASKRVGTCLKPGPKSKTSKVKTEASPSGSSTSSLPVELPRPVMTAPRSLEDCSHLPPVSVEEFKAAFDVTPAGTLIPKPGMEDLMDRMMYATCETVVDQCFRHCYVVGSEYHKVAEKQSKYFKCSFDECVGSSTRIFMRKSAVDSHVRTHVGFRPFKCEVDPECDARFVRKHDRDRHVATTHKNEKSFNCGDCGQNFARSDALLRHRAKRDACKARMG